MNHNLQLGVPGSHGDPQNQPGFAREVSSEWHVHLVRETDMLTQSRRYPLASKCEMCVQAPNGRKHSSLFAVHLIPHWLPSSGKKVGEPTTHMACTTQNIKAASCATDGWQEHDPTQRLRLTARLTDEATGEEFPDAVLFNAHPNGHLYGGSPDKETDVLCVPICGCIKARARAPAGHAAPPPRRPASRPTTRRRQALMKIVHPIDPISSPSRSRRCARPTARPHARPPPRRPPPPPRPHRRRPRAQLAAMKLSIIAEFTCGQVTWSHSFACPGVIKLVSRVTERALEEQESGRRRRASEIATLAARTDEEAAASILMGAPPTPLPLPAPAAIASALAQESSGPVDDGAAAVPIRPSDTVSPRREAQRKSELFVQAYLHNPQARSGMAVLDQAPAYTWPGRAPKRPRRRRRHAAQTRRRVTRRRRLRPRHRRRVLRRHRRRRSAPPAGLAAARTRASPP